jgi:ornithine cyclodeaminase/alanine dehydrogenase-like protein (mu-crystallin family)
MTLTRLLTRTEIARLIDDGMAVAAVEEAFRRLGEGTAPAPAVLGYVSGGGGFHLKAARLDLDGPYFAVKCNGNFAGNPGQRGLPTIQGAIVLCDAEDGRVLAVLDSVEITAQRTAAATAVAARWCARPDSAVLTICGCGVQGRSQLRALRRELPLRQVYAWDERPEVAATYARELCAETGIAVETVAVLCDGTLRSDVIVTCTSSRTWFLGTSDVRPGTFVAAVGADSEVKQEIEPALLASARVIVDVLDQAAQIGDLHHALECGAMRRADVAAELGEVVAGRKPGRGSAAEIVVFDSTGTAVQDVALAARVWRRAHESNAGFALDFMS